MIMPKQMEFRIQKKPISYYDSDRADMLQFVPTGVKKSLEFGCGTGKFSALLKETFKAESWAVEINRDAAKSAAEKLDKVICCDVNESLVQLPQGYFDCIIFFDILEHLVDPYSLLTAVKDKLSEKGILVASIPNIRYYRAFAEYVFKGNWDYKEQGIMDRTHLRFFTKKSIVKMLNELGFEILSIQGIHPTSSRSYRLLNLLFLGGLRDVRYKHFVVIAKCNT